MLGKLFKHEIKATARLLLPLYLILAALTIMDRIVLNLHIFKGAMNLIPGFITFAYVLSIIALIVVSTVIIIFRFYKNLMTDEGYLMFTLPVKSHELINSKLIASFIWSFASIASVIASLFIVFSSDKNLQLLKDGLRTMHDEFVRQFGSMSALLISEFIILFIVAAIYAVLMIFVSIAIGQLMNGHKVIGSIAAYIAINFAIQIISTIAMVIIGQIFKNNINDISLIPKLLFPLLISFYAVLSAVYYAVTNFIFRNKLNLD